MKRHPFCVNGSKFADSAFFLNVAATSPVFISDCKQAINTVEIYARPNSKTCPGISKNLSQIHCFQALYIGGRELATIDRLLTVPLVVEKL